MYILLSLLTAITLITLAGFFFQKISHRLQQHLLQELNNTRLQQQAAINEQNRLQDERQMQTMKTLHDSIQSGVQTLRLNVKESLNDYATDLGKRFEALTLTTEGRLKDINQQVEQRLNAGFEKTHQTFTDVIQRLAVIDAAQQKISELSTQVVNLQDVLNDKRSRGAFGEVQLNAIIRNILPETQVAFQHSLSNHTRVDCLIFLPEPTGNIPIDAKFPLENFQIMMDFSLNDADRLAAKQQFKRDIKKHIQDVSSKYIIAGETSEGAILFIPAEAIFAEIHAHHPDLVEYAHQNKIWMASPTTLVAILTTARAVLKDTATRKQLHIIQEHLRLLANDFKRFQLRMDDVAKYITRAQTEVDQVHVSAKKITSRFDQIEKVDLEAIVATPKLEEPQDSA